MPRLISFVWHQSTCQECETRDPKGHISCSWVNCFISFINRSNRTAWFSTRPKNTRTLVEDVEILIPVKFCWIPFSGFRGKVEISQPIIGQGGHLVFFFQSIPQNTNKVVGVEILISVKFRWIPFWCFRWDIETVSANQRPGRPTCFSYQPQTQQYGRGRWALDFCQVLLNSVLQFQRKSHKCLSQSEASAAI